MKRTPKPRGPQYTQQSERGFEAQYQFAEEAEAEYSDEDVSDRATAQKQPVT